jgi:DNA-binding CsgD family transcriptional regulator
MRMHFASPATIQQVIRSAQQEVLLTLPPSRTPPSVAVDVAAVRGVAADGIPVSVYVPEASRGTPDLPEAELVRLARAGVTIFATSGALPRMGLVDRNVVVAACNQCDYADGGLIGRELPFTPLLVRSLQLDALAAAAPEAAPNDELAASDAVKSLDREVLRHLARGAKDETAAREMGLSLRTYRRLVAHLMNGLGARSRFQAGFLAARRR